MNDMVVKVDGKIVEMWWYGGEASSDQKVWIHVNMPPAPKYMRWRSRMIANIKQFLCKLWWC